MLASEPPSSRVHGISVRVNGTTVTGVEKSGVQRSGNSDNSCFAVSGDSEKLAECSEAGWADATITWRTGAQLPDVPNSSKLGGYSSPTYDAKVPASQLVHVIRVQNATQNPLQDSCSVTEDSIGGMEHRDLFSACNNRTGKSLTPARIRITSNTNSLYQADSVHQDTFNYCKDKISVVVRPSLNQMVKGEDERSSSGASSAPGSDCERSDSDRELDDGTDSGFSSSRRHRASIMVNTKNTNSGNNNTYLLSDCNNTGITKVPVVSSNKENVKLTIASYVDKESENDNETRSETHELWSMPFHLREFDTQSVNKNLDTDDIPTKIAAAHALLSGKSGAFNFKNRVQSSIYALLVQSHSSKNFVKLERGRLIVYMTTVGIIRSTSERCRTVQKILDTLILRYEMRDVSSNEDYLKELCYRLEKPDYKVELPQVFMDGYYLGNAQKVEQLNEAGTLRDLLAAYRKEVCHIVPCPDCDNTHYINCQACHGRRKVKKQLSPRRGDIIYLHCVRCNRSGLVPCPMCCWEITPEYDDVDDDSDEEDVDNVNVEVD